MKACSPELTLDDDFKIIVVELEVAKKELRKLRGVKTRAIPEKRLAEFADEMRTQRLMQPIPHHMYAAVIREISG